MVRYQPHAKFLIQCLAVLIIIPSVISQGFWNSTVAPKNAKKYDAIVKRYVTKIYTYYVCQGAIINNRYVLTARNCTQDGNTHATDVSVIVGYSHVGQLEKGLRNFQGNAGEYNASSVYSIASLALVRTQDPIKFNEKVNCINLPIGQYFKGWRHSFGVPNHVRYDSSYWCRDQKAKDYFLYYKCGTRNCTYNMIYNTPKWYIPTCLNDKNAPAVCKWVRGAPLVYNKTLVGIRNYNGEKAPAPYNKVKGELFVNVARHVNEISELMFDYEPCPE